MKKCMWTTAFLVLCLTCLSPLGASAVGIVPTYPVAELTSYDAATYAYTYTVSVGAADSFAFGHFRVYAEVPNLGSTGGWVTDGPAVNGQAVSGWSTVIGRWDTSAQPKDYVDWQASAPAEVPRGTDWVGVFTLVAPNTLPVDGWLYTSDGPGSEHTLQGLVPGSAAAAVPEPCSLLSAAYGIAAILGLRRVRLNRR